MSLSPIIRNFNAAAETYDQAAALQAQVAKLGVDWAKDFATEPKSFLDLGSGTGMVAGELYRQWPKANVTALDASPAMLHEAQRKMPQLKIIQGDLLAAEPEEKFDAIFSSMVFHWLPDPRSALQRWQKFLKPEGMLFAALPVKGSFQEWRDLCAAHGMQDGLWPLPSPDFADGLANATQLHDITVTHPTARDFLLSMKQTGAATARSDHRPMNAARLRALLISSRQTCAITYRLLFLAVRAPCP